MVLQQMVPKVVKESHKEVVRIGVEGEEDGEDEEKDKTGASSETRLSSLDTKSIFNTNGMTVRRLRGLEKAWRSGVFSAAGCAAVVH
jgi:hypothetical protein